MQIIAKDILTVEKGIIVHQVNCRGVMGSGVAKALKDKWPIIFHRYQWLCKNYKSGYLLGQIDPTLISNKNGELWVVNLFGQDDFGNENKRYTQYYAWDKALDEIKQLQESKHLPKDIYFPYFCGCDRGRGNWGIISRLIEEYFPNAIICKLP